MTLVAFDFDGTLSDSEMTVLLGRQRGVADEMAAITERAMNDEISYAKSLRDRATLLEGLSDEKAEEAFADVYLRPDAATVIRELNEAGVTTAVLTGGFERGVEVALEREGVSVDTIVANRLPVAEGESEAESASGDASGQRSRALTGGVEGPLIEGTKDDALERLAGEHEIAMSDTVAVGDGANDLPMLEVAGLSVGFLPKSAVRPSCDVVVATMERLRDVFDEEGLLD
jgi:phosphoserine phosphatase